METPWSTRPPEWFLITSLTTIMFSFPQRHPSFHWCTHCFLSKGCRSIIYYFTILHATILLTDHSRMRAKAWFWSSRSRPHPEIPEGEFPWEVRKNAVGRMNYGCFFVMSTCGQSQRVAFGGERWDAQSWATLKLGLLLDFQFFEVTHCIINSIAGAYNSSKRERISVNIGWNPRFWLNY